MSKATQNLRELETFGGEVAQIDDAATALERVGPDPDTQSVPDTDEDGKAKFGTAEAIATAIVGSVILGPIGGLIIGGAQGLFQRKTEQSLLDSIAAENEAFKQAGEVYDDTIADLKSAAETPEELANVSALEAKRTAAMGLFSSGSEDLKRAGIAAFSSFENDMVSLLDKNETQKIAKDAYDARLRLELDDKQFNRVTSMQEKYTAESQPYTETMRFGDLTLRAIEQGTPAQIYAAMIGFNKTIDPNSAVLGEEREALKATGSLIDKGYQAFMEAWEGSPSTSKQRRQLADATMTTMGAMQRQQDIREAGYIDRLAQDNFDPRYYDDFLKSQQQEVYVPNIEPDAAEIADGLNDAAKARQSMLIGDAADAVIGGVESLIDREKRLADERSMAIGDTVDAIKAGVPNAMDSFNQYLNDLTQFAGGGPRIKETN